METAEARAAVAEAAGRARDGGTPEKTPTTTTGTRAGAAVDAGAANDATAGRDGDGAEAKGNDASTDGDGAKAKGDDDD